MFENRFSYAVSRWEMSICSSIFWVKIVKCPPFRPNSFFLRVANFNIWTSFKNDFEVDFFFQEIINTQLSTERKYFTAFFEKWIQTNAITLSTMQTEAWMKAFSERKSQLFQLEIVPRRMFINWYNHLIL